MSEDEKAKEAEIFAEQPQAPDPVAEAKAMQSRRGRKPNSYPLVIKAACIALKSAGVVSTKDIATELGISEKLVRKALTNREAISVEDLEKVKMEYAAEMAEVVALLFTQIKEDGVIARMKGDKLVDSAAKLIDRINLLTNKPTQIVETQAFVNDASSKLKTFEEMEAALKRSLEPKDN